VRAHLDGCAACHEDHKSLREVVVLQPSNA
jgi:hypothetical protein